MVLKFIFGGRALGVVVGIAALVVLMIIALSGTAAASSVSITSTQDYMEQQFVSNGSFPSGLTDLIYRMGLHVNPVSGNFQVSKVVIYNTTRIGINRTYYQIDEIDKGRGTITVFPNRVEWQGLAETPIFEFELGIHAANPYRLDIPFSSTRLMEKEIFNGQDIVTGYLSATPSQNLRFLRIWTFASESDDIYSQLLNSTATNPAYIDRSSSYEVRWNFQNVLAGNVYTASVQGIATPKKNGTIRAWPYTKVEAGYGSYSYTSSGYGATVVRYTDPVIGDVEIYFVNPVDYQISANGRGIYFQRFRPYSEVVTNGEPPTVEIDDNFKPGIRTVPAGTTVTWTNNLKIHHNIVSNTGLFSSPSLGQYQQFSYSFNNPGTYDYSCGIHPSMKGTVIVTGSAVLNATIRGTITNATSTTPIAGATVVAGSIVAITDTGGNYTISMAPGTYLVTARATGYITNSTPITLASGATVVKNFALQPGINTLPPAVAPFDTSGDGIIQRGEAVNCVVQFFTMQVPRPTAVAVVVAFFTG